MLLLRSLLLLLCGVGDWGSLKGYTRQHTVATYILSSAFSGVVELTTQLLRLISILCLPLCRINKLGYTYPRRLLRSPTLVGYQVFARYIGTNCRNGPPVKQIWVLKELIDKLPVNADAASLRKTSEDKSTHGHDYEHVSSNHFIHREAENKHAYSFVYPDASEYRPARFPRNRRSSYASRPPIPMWVVKKN